MATKTWPMKRSWRPQSKRQDGREGDGGRRERDCVQMSGVGRLLKMLVDTTLP